MKHAERVEDGLRAERFLMDRFGAGIGAVELLGAGEWSSAYGFRSDAVDYVVRFGAFQEDFAKDRLAASFSSAALPIPNVAEIGEAFGGFYAISERVFGTFLDDLDEVGLRAVLPALFAALDAARLVELSGSAGYGLWRADGNASGSSWSDWLLTVAEDTPTERTHGWRPRLARSPTGEAPFDEAMDAMTALLPYCPERRHLVHSDLVHNNVLVSDGRITGVLDWGCALYGDFLYDIAWLSFWSPWYPAWRTIDFPREARRHYTAIGLDPPYFEQRLRCYQLHIGLAGQAYNAFKERWDELDATAQRTLALARTQLR